MCKLSRRSSQPFICIQHAIAISIGIIFVSDAIAICIRLRDRGCLRTGFAICVHNGEFERATFCCQSCGLERCVFQQVLHIHSSQATTIVVGDIQCPRCCRVVYVVGGAPNRDLVVETVRVECDLQFGRGFTIGPPERDRFLCRLFNPTHLNRHRSQVIAVAIRNCDIGIDNTHGFTSLKFCREIKAVGCTVVCVQINDGSVQGELITSRYQRSRFNNTHALFEIPVTAQFFSTS